MENVRTFGQHRVRLDFNPGANELVTQLKQKTAAIIDLVDTIKQDEIKKHNGEAMRLVSLAQTAFE